MVVSDIRRHKIMEEALRSIMGAGLPPSFKFEDTYSSIVFPPGYTVPNETTVTNKFDELLAVAGDNQKTSVLGDLEVGTANLYVDVSASSVGIGTSTPNATLEVVGNVHVSSNLEVGTANLFVDTDTGYVGIGTTVPEASLEVLGNTYVSSNLGVSDTFIVDTTKGCVGLGTTTPNASLEVQGNAYISSNLQVGSLFVDTTKGRVGIGTTTPKANLHVEGNVHITNGGYISKKKALRVHTGSATVNMGGGNTLTSSLRVTGNVYISSNLNVSNVLSVDTTTGNVGIGVSDPDATLTVNHRIHRENHKHIFDLEHLKPEYLKTSPSEYRYVCMEDNPPGQLVPGVSQYTYTDIYDYNPSTGTSSLVKSLDLTTTFSLAVSQNRQYYSSKPFFLGGLNNYHHTVVPMTALGRIFIVRSTREKPITNYVYAPYDDVTINVYLSKSINETPTFTHTLTKETVYSWVDNPDNENHTLTVEAVDGVILMSRKGDPGNVDTEVVFPASDLVYNLTRPDYIPGTFFHNIFNGNEGNSSKQALNAIVNGAAIYSPDGSMATITYRGDADGGEQNHPIPYELLGDTYYIGHNINGYMIAGTEYRQTITAEYLFSSTWTTHDTFNTQKGVTPTRPQYWAKGNIGGYGTGFSVQATAWRFKSSHGKIYVRTEASNEYEYSVSGWLENTSTYNFYKLPTYGPSIYKCGLKTTVNINAGDKGTDVIYSIFSSTDSDITPHYGAGYSKKSDDKHIYVPSPGTYRVSFVIQQKRTDTTSARTCVTIGLTVNGSVNNNLRTDHSYIRNYDGHRKSTSHFSEIVEINDTRLVGLFFKRRTTITEPVYVDSYDSSFFMIEKIG
jgi:hypothetical protein